MIDNGWDINDLYDSFLGPADGSGGGGGGGGSPKYKTYDVVSSIDGYYGQSKTKITFVNSRMTRNILNPDSGNGVDMTAHLLAKGLTVTDARFGGIVDALGDKKVDVITIGTHGGFGFVDMNGPPTLSINQHTGSDEVWAQLKDHLNPGATIVLLGCEFGGNDFGIEQMEKIAKATGATVVAPTGQYSPVYTGSKAEPVWSGSADIRPTDNTPAGMPMGYIVVPPPKG